MKSQELKPQDVLVLLKIHVSPGSDWTPRTLAANLFMSYAEVFEGLKRAEAARLYNAPHKRPVRRALEEFLIHGVKYVYAPQRGGLTRGMPTCYAAPPLSHVIVQPNEPPPVWPDPMGPRQGFAFSPLYKSVPQAAAQDPMLYEMLALVDAIRDGRAREAEIAARELTLRLRGAKEQSI